MIMEDERDSMPELAATPFPAEEIAVSPAFGQPNKEGSEIDIKKGPVKLINSRKAQSKSTIKRSAINGGLGQPHPYSISTTLKTPEVARKLR